MDNINEKLHIPDPINVEILIENIIKALVRYWQDDLYKHNRFTGYEMKNEYLESFILDPNENPCRWLATDTEFHFKLTIVEEKSSCKGVFGPSERGGFVTLANSERVIHGGKFNFELDVNFADIPSMFRPPHVNNFALNVREVLRHELTHAYREMYMCTLFKCDDEKTTVKSGNFYKAYWKVTNEYSGIISGNVKKNLFTTLYMTNPMERDPFISQFYQSLVNDITTRKGIQNIKDYQYYDIYIGVRNFIDSFDDEKMFTLFRDEYIIPMFGKTCSNVESFKKEIKRLVDQIIYKMQTIYHSMKAYGTIIGDADIEHTKHEFSNLKVDSVGTKVDEMFGEEFKIVAYDVLPKLYLNTEVDQRAESIEDVFRIYPKGPGRIPCYV